MDSPSNSAQNPGRDHQQAKTSTSQRKSVLAALASTALAETIACGLGGAVAVAAPVQPDLTTSSVATQAQATTPTPAPKPADPAATTAPDTPAAPAYGSVSHSGKGTSIWFYNKTDAPVKVGDDVATTVSD